MERSQKEAQVSELRSIFNNTSAGILVDYRGIEANQIVELRKKLNEASSTMKVIKNSLARLAAEDTPFSELAEQFTQTRALVFSAGDAVQQAKVLSEAAKKLENLKILAGILVDENKTSILNTGEVVALSKLPSREELLMKLLFLMQAPATQFVSTLNAVPAKFVRTLAAIRDSKQ
ncbi:MAG: 50S ribosomal protein L10 [SAR324 cluster bacterium]|nr:50S ribosomal protein L10 [SAR324 cluster bacterium]MBL7035425.1 50S ribosomal protein L10 [SAR324 cluster bacterium]